MTTTTIDNSQDIIDSRDIVARIDYLLTFDLDELDDDEREELGALQKLAEEGKGYAPDWQYGATLIRDTYFKEYAQDLAEDIGAINREMSWPHDCIDWDMAADALKMDYTSVDFDGVDYWIR